MRVWKFFVLVLVVEPNEVCKAIDALRAFTQPFNVFIDANVELCSDYLWCCAQYQVLLLVPRYLGLSLGLRAKPAASD